MKIDLNDHRAAVLVPDLSAAIEKLGREATAVALGISGHTLRKVLTGTGSLRLDAVERIEDQLPRLLALPVEDIMRGPSPKDTARHSNDLLDYFYSRRPHLRGMPLQAIIERTQAVGV